MNNGMKMTENFADSDNIHILLKWGVIIKCCEGGKISEVAM